MKAIVLQRKEQTAALVGVSAQAMSAKAARDRRAIARYSIPYLVLAIAIASGNNIADPDLWMHLFAGRQIIATLHLPAFNSYSYSAPGFPWRNHVWLSQVILALSYDVLGILGLRIVKLACVAVIMCSLAAGIAKTAAGPRARRLILLFVAAGLVGQVQFRPQLFTLASLSFEMAVLAAVVYDGRARMWTLIPLFALWANLHGGYVTGIAALAVFTLFEGITEYWQKKTLADTSKIAGIAVCCAIATLANPFGLQLWTRVLHSVSDPIVRSNIQEWNTLGIAFTRDWTLPLAEKLKWVIPLGLFGAFALAVAAAPLAGDLSLQAVGLVFMAAAFHAYRNIALAIIALSIPLAHHIGVLLGDRDAQTADAARNQPAGLFVIIAALVIAVETGELSTHLRTFGPVPRGAVAFMKEHGLQGNILNQYEWGSYLVWHGAPRDKVFVDGRCEVVYPDRLLREYFIFLNAGVGGQKLLDRYPHDYILISPKSGAYRNVAADRRWKLLYRDRIAALFARADDPRAKNLRPEFNRIPEQAWFP